jgi:hypothetical protein
MSLNPNMSTGAAVRKSSAHVMGRSQFVLGTFVQSGETSTVLDDMGITGDPTQNPVHIAALGWLAKYGPMPADQGGFGGMYGRVNPDPNDPSWKRWLGNVLRLSTTRDGENAPGMDALSSRGVPQLKTWYNPQEKVFYFQQYADTTMDALEGPVMHVTAKELGDFYNNTIRAQTQDSPFVGELAASAAKTITTGATNSLEWMVKNHIGLFNIPVPPEQPKP